MEIFVILEIVDNNETTRRASWEVFVGRKVARLDPIKVGELELSTYREYVEYKKGWCPQGTANAAWNPDLVGKIKQNPHEWGSMENYIDPCRPEIRWKSEQKARDIIQEITGRLFPKVRPLWMPGPRGPPLELDGYCEDLMLAFEYQGIQHYIEVKFFHRADGDFDYQVLCDKIKVDTCGLRGVQLIVIPFTYSFKTPDLLWKNFIYSEMAKGGPGLRALPARPVDAPPIYAAPDPLTDAEINEVIAEFV
jgi:hypothetical protein